MNSNFRLRQGADFRRVYEDGRRKDGNLLVIHVAAGTAAPARVGFSVSTRVGNAVVRNRVRRRLREAVRPILERANEPVDIVVVARPRAASASFAELESEFRELAGKLVSF